MEFPLTNEQKYIQKAVREFARGEFDDDQILELLQGGSFPQTLLKKACKLDFIGLCYPENCGGQGCGLMEQVLVIEELCRKDSAAGIALSTVDAGAEVIAIFGNEKQQKKYLPPFTKGKAISAFMYADADDGEGSPMSTSLTPGGKDTYLLSGEAAFVFNADLAELLIVQTQLAADSASAGGSVFALVGKGAPGVSIIPMGDKLGMGMLSWHKVIFQAVEVFEADVIRPEPSVMEGGIRFRQIHLLRMAAMYLGLAQGAFDLALTYARQRVQFNRKIGEFQGIRHKLADMYVNLQAGRSLVYAAAANCDRGQVEPHDLLTVKLVAERTALFATDEALQIFGGSGYMVELPVEHFYRDARTLRAFTGSKMLQKDLIAQAVIGRIS
jgi:alkylation response protein AidB-like acyl-CoA dehydrogenase